MTNILHPGFAVNPNYGGDSADDIAEYTEYGTLVCNETAREIAAWWQSEDGDGWHFAVFATSGAVTTDLPNIITAMLADDDIAAEHTDELTALQAHIASYSETSDL